MADIAELIRKAIDNGQKSLSEHDSKKVLAACNIPVSKEYFTETKDAAIVKAAEIGFPVALKACSHDIMHKSEGGLVEISLDSPDAVSNAFDRIKEKTSGPLEGILVQEMVAGQRELVLGLIKDPQFGPCVMAGFGGIMTEVISDTCFRMAPIDAVEAADMLDELKTKTMLGSFRGQEPVDTKSLCDALVSLGNIGMTYPAITEIDINPVIIRRDGTFAAVDALVVLERSSK